MDVKMGNGAMRVEGCIVAFIPMPVGFPLILEDAHRKVLLRLV